MRARLSSIVVVLAFTTVAAIPARAGQLAYWSFDGCTVTDGSGNGRTLATNGTPTCVAGRFGSAWQLNGTDQWFDRGDDAFQPVARAWTVALWERSNDASGFHALLGWYRCGARPNCSSADGASYILGLSDGHADWSVRDDVLGSGVLDDSVTAVANGAWHFLVGTYDPATDTLKLYVDGARRLASQAPLGTLTGSAIPMDIGRLFRTGWGTPGNYFDGALDEVRIYDQELTAGEIANLYASNATAGVDPAGVSSLRIDVAGPNPARGGRFAVSFALATSDPAELGVFDVAGRRVERAEIAGRGPGPGRAEFGQVRSLAPGVYQLRLQQGRSRVSRSVVVIR